MSKRITRIDPWRTPRAAAPPAARRADARTGAPGARAGAAFPATGMTGTQEDAVFPAAGRPAPVGGESAAREGANAAGARGAAPGEWYSPRALAGLPGMPGTVQGVALRAARQAWPSRRRAARGGGREYHQSAFPPATRQYLFGGGAGADADAETETNAADAGTAGRPARNPGYAAEGDTGAIAGREGPTNTGPETGRGTRDVAGPGGYPGPGTSPVTLPIADPGALTSAVFCNPAACAHRASPRYAPHPAAPEQSAPPMAGLSPAPPPTENTTGSSAGTTTGNSADRTFERFGEAPAARDGAWDAASRPGPAADTYPAVSGPALPGPSDVIPEKDRRVALARLDVVRLWEEYRDGGASGPGFSPDALLSGISPAAAPSHAIPSASHAIPRGPGCGIAASASPPVPASGVSTPTPAPSRRSGSRSSRGASRTPSRGTADAEFIRAYNTGSLFPALFAATGSVSLPTLYRWRAALSGTQDWTLLVPQYRPVLRAERLTPEEARVFFGILLHPHRVKIGAAFALTAFHLKKRGLPLTHCAMTFRRAAEDYRRRHYDRWVLMREGEKALAGKVTFAIRRDASLLDVGEALVADGHRLNFQIVNPHTGRPCRATLVGFLDWKSWDLAGYEIMVEETTQCIASAFRHAILRLGKAPRVLYLDNGRAFRARFFTATGSFEEEGVYGLFARLGTTPVFARPYNARAKVIERWFREFSETFERLVPSYTGASVADKPARLMRNERWHKALYGGRVPTVGEAVEMIGEWHAFHRSRPCPHVPGRTIGEVFDAGRGPGVDARELDDLMMTARAARIGPNGIRFLGADYYHEAMHGLREQCTIRYSLFDLSFVLVYDASGAYLCRAERLPLAHPVAALSANPCDLETVKRLNAAQKTLTRRTMRESAEERRSLAPADHGWGGAQRAGGEPWAAEMSRAGKARGRKTVRHEGSMIYEAGALRGDGRHQAPGIDPVLPLPIEERIPEEALAPARPVQPSDHPAAQGGARPFFSGPDADVQRYDWHLAHGFFTPEDAEFRQWFESTDMYRMLYVMIPRQQRDAAETG